MKPGDRVQFIAGWSSFYGLQGVVAQTSPYLAVVFDDDPRAIRVGEREVVRIEVPQHIGGAE